MRLLAAISWTIVCTAILIPGCTQNQDRRAEIEATKQIRVGTDATYPPFESVDPSTQKVVGFDADMIRQVFGNLGYEVEFIVVPFDGITAGLHTGKYDVIVSAFTITPERKERVLFSDPYYDAGQTIAVPLHDSVTQTTEDLRGKRAGVQLGTTGERLAKQIDELEVFSYDNISAAFIDMANGKLDAVINDKPTSERYIAVQHDAKLVGQLLSQEQYGVAFRRTDTWLHEMFNAEFAKFKDTEAFKKLHDTYIRGNASP